MSNTHPRISIIMPIYNAALYLKRAVDSCLAQTVSEIEIILIDDCSKDCSAEMIREYEKEYPDKVKGVYLSENGGQGAARNKAISISKGDYLLFVDSDDWIEPDTCEKMLAAAEAENADAVGADYIIHKGGQESILHLKYDTINDPETEQDAMARYIMDCGFFWSRMYKRSLFTEHDITFPIGLLYEDSYVNFLTSLYANKIIKISGEYYHYLINDTSSCHKRNDRRHYDREKVVNLTYQACVDRGLYIKFKELVDLKYCSMMAGGVHEYIDLFDRPDKKRLRSLCDNIKEKIPNFRRIKYYKMISVSGRVLLEACMISPSLAITMFKLRKKLSRRA